MSIPSDANKAALEAARQPDGKFGTRPAAEADVDAMSLAEPTTANLDAWGAKFRPAVDLVERRWRDEADTDGTFNALIANLAKRMIADDSIRDRVGRPRLVEALDAFAESGFKDDDQAEEVIYAMQDLTEQKQWPPTAEAQTEHDATDDEDDDFDADAHDAVHDAADVWALAVNAEGRASQVWFLRRMRVSDDEIISAAQGADPDFALDEMVLDVASQTASQAYNDGESDGEVVTKTLEGYRWMLSGTDTFKPGVYAVSLQDSECTDVTFDGPDGTSVTYRVSYHEWVPDGDDNTPARGYLRGEFRAETEWHAYEAPLARESAPFRPAKGEGGQQKSYAWEKFYDSLRVAAKNAHAKQRNDPLRALLTDGNDR